MGREFRRGGQAGRAVKCGARFHAHQLQQHAQPVCRVNVVVDHEHAFAHHHRIGFGGGRRRRRRRRFQQRQAHREHAALSRPVAVGVDLAALHFKQAAHQGQAYAYAALGHAGSLRRLGEQVEDARQDIGRHAAAVIRDGDQHLGALAPRPQADFPATVGVLGGVAQQVGDDLRQPHRIRVHRQGVVGHLEQQLMVCRIQQGLAGLEHAVQGCGHVDRFWPQLHLAARDARDFQQIVDQANHVIHLPLQQRQQVSRGFGVALGQLQHLQTAAHRRQRVAQLVRKNGQEFVLAPVGIAQCRFLALALGNVVEQHRHLAVLGRAYAKRIDIEKAL